MILWGFTRDSPRIQWGFSRESVENLEGLRRGSVGMLVRVIFITAAVAGHLKAKRYLGKNVENKDTKYISPRISEKLSIEINLN